MNRKQRRAAKVSGQSAPQGVAPSQGGRREIQGLLAEAVQHHQADRLGEAQRLYQQILAIDSRNDDSLHLLGLIAHQIGNHQVAIELVGQAIALNPAEATYHSNLGIALYALGRIDEGIACHRRALALEPNHAEAHNNLGVGLKDLGRFDEAVASYRKAVTLKPNYAEAHNNLGIVLIELGRLDEAVARFNQAIALQPGYAEAHANLGNALQQQGRRDEAMASYRKAIALRPSYAVAHCDLGVALNALGRRDEAMECYRAAIALQPDYAVAHNNLGVTMTALGRLDEAIACHRHALALKPDFADALTNLGVALREQGQIDAGIACHRQAIVLNPNHADAHNNLGFDLLLSGAYSEGWRELEWRFRSGAPARPFAQRRWAGEDLSGRTLLVWGEQGIGDEILFFGFLPELLERGARVVVECDPRLVPMLHRALPRVEAVARQNPPDPRCLAADIDFQIAAGNVAGLLRPSLPDFRPLPPYLRPDTAVVAELRHNYGGDQGRPLVGISWWSRNATARQRSFSLAQWRPILTVPGVRFVSLQYGDHRAEIDAVSRELGVEIIHDDSVDPVADIDRAAAQIAAMDLTITMDNSTVHLAAMLGAPALLLLPLIPTWRAGLAGESSPWSPGVRIFRQRTLGDWAPVIDGVAEALRPLSAAPPSQSPQATFAEALRCFFADQLDQAEALFRQALAVLPGNADTLHLLGLIALKQGRHQVAIDRIGQAISANPEAANYYANMGIALAALERQEEAVASFRRAIALNPDLVEAQNGLGVVLKDLRRLDDAVAHHRRALALKPDFADAHTNLGIALREQGHSAQAIACHRRAIALQPDHAQAHNNLGDDLLLAGDYARGWAESEWRFRAGTPSRPFAQPRWNGEDLAGRTLLVWGERGIGDEILFFALLPELLDRGARLVVECDRRLVPMFKRALPQIEAVARTNPPNPRCFAGDIDLQVPAGTLCALLRPSLAKFRPLTPYLRPDAATVAEFRHRYGADQGVPLVGISWWSENPTAANRRFALSQWRPILKIPGLRFVSLQYGDRRAEIEAVSRELGIEIIHDDSVDPIVDMDRAAAQIAAMDMTVTMDNSTAHFAAMLGAPALMPLPFVTTWRSGLTGETSPWSPGIRLFRQKALGAWAPVIDRVAKALDQWARKRRPGDLPPGKPQSAQPLFDEALGHHQAGRLAEAEGLYRRALAVDPRHADSLHLLGVIDYQAGNLAPAIDSIGRAIAIDGKVASFHANLGLALAAAGRLDEAISHQRRAIALDRDFDEAHCNLALALMAQGRFDDAIASFNAAIALNPRHVTAHYNLGLALYQRGRLDEAVASILKAIAINPRFVEAYNNLGLALKDLGRLDDAVTCYRQAITLNPAFGEAHNNLGIALQRQGRLDEAVTCYQRAGEFSADIARAQSNLGGALRALGRLDEAVSCFRAALDANPNHVEAHFNLGLALGGQGHQDDAAACFRAAIALKPDHAEAHTSLSGVLADLGRLDEAVACCRRALEIEPNSAEAHNHLSGVLSAMGHSDEAVAHAKRALELRPDFVDAQINLGVAARDLGRLDDAVACFRTAIALNPDCAEAHTNLGVALLLAGNYPDGWRDYGWRFKPQRGGHSPRQFPQPIWTGEDLAGRTLLVWGEQGIGDEPIFFALLPELLERGARLVVECDARLMAPLARSLPGIELVARQNPPAPRATAGDIDFQIAAGNVAALLRPTRADFRPLAPYLRPDPTQVAELRRRYGGDPRARLVGLSWWSRADRAGLRSFALAQWRPILLVPGLRFVSLQYGDHRAEIAAVSRELGVEILHDDQIDPMADTDQALAQIAAMDQIVSMDNSAVHLAAMLGRPAHMLVPQVSTWRTGMTGESSPWMPGIALFRQQKRGDWTAVIDQVAESLARWTVES